MIQFKIQFHSPCKWLELQHKKAINSESYVPAISKTSQDETPRQTFMELSKRHYADRKVTYAGTIRSCHPARPSWENASTDGIPWTGHPPGKDSMPRLLCRLTNKNSKQHGAVAYARLCPPPDTSGRPCQETYIRVSAGLGAATLRHYSRRRWMRMRNSPDCAM